MHVKIKVLIIMFVNNIALFAHAQNLILNPSCDDTLVNGNIPYWQEIIGTNWSQRCSSPSPLSGNGNCYFFAGSDPVDELVQTINVSNYSSEIDNGTQVFYFHGYEVSYDQSPADEANIIIEFKDTDDTLISGIQFGPYTQTANWQELDSALQVPPLTRNVSIKLRSVRQNGSNNDGYYDELYLGANPWVGVSELSSDFNFSFYPNPSRGELNVSLIELPDGKTTFTLSNLFGRKLMEIKLVSKITSLNLVQPNGVYIATITTKTDIYQMKIIIVR